MQISELTLSRFGAHDRIRISSKDSGPLWFITGANEAGKTTILDAVSLVTVGFSQRVRKKSDMRELVRDGAKDATIEAVIDDQPRRCRLTAAGTYDLPEALPIDLDLLAVATGRKRWGVMRADTRAALLDSLRVKSESSGSDALISYLHENGRNRDQIDRVLPFFDSDPATMETRVKEAATRAKGRWEQTTGERWGSKKGGEWVPDMPSLGGPSLSDQLDTARKTCKDLTDKIEDVRANMRQLRTFANLPPAAEIEAMRGMVARIPKAQELLAEAEAAYQDAKQAEAVIACPCCDEPLRLIDGALVKAEGLENVLSLDDAEDDRTAAREQLDTLLKAERRLDTIDALGDRPDGDLDQLKRKEKKLVSDHSEAAKHYDSIQSTMQTVEHLETAQELSRDLHQEILLLSDMASECGPSGWGRQKGAGALVRINTMMAELCSVAGWPIVALTPDLSVQWGGRRYSLCAESAQYRADFIIALSVALLTGLNWVAIDRVDVLDKKQRGGLLKLLSILAREQRLDQALLFCTMLGDEVLSIPQYTHIPLSNKAAAMAQAA